MLPRRPRTRPAAVRQAGAVCYLICCGARAGSRNSGRNSSGILAGLMKEAGRERKLALDWRQRGWNERGRSGRGQHADVIEQPVFHNRKYEPDHCTSLCVATPSRPRCQVCATPATPVLGGEVLAGDGPTHSRRPRRPRGLTSVPQCDTVAANVDTGGQDSRQVLPQGNHAHRPYADVPGTTHERGVHDRERSRRSPPVRAHSRHPDTHRGSGSTAATGHGVDSCDCTLAWKWSRMTGGIAQAGHQPFLKPSARCRSTTASSLKQRRWLVARPTPVVP